MVEFGNRIIDRLDMFFGLQGDDTIYNPVNYNSLKLDDIEDIMDDCFLARHKNGKNQFIFFGNNLIKAIGDGEKSNIENLVFSNDHELTKKFKTVLETKKPLLEESFFINEDKLEVRYRQKLFPLFNDDEELEYIFGGIRWKKII